jgi:hypothetical protein
MGAEPWDYFVSYEEDTLTAQQLRVLRRLVHEEFG